MIIDIHVQLLTQRKQINIVGKWLEICQSILSD